MTTHVRLNAGLRNPLLDRVDASELWIGSLLIPYVNMYTGAIAHTHEEKKRLIRLRAAEIDDVVDHIIYIANANAAIADYKHEIAKMEQFGRIFAHSHKYAKMYIQLHGAPLMMRARKVSL